MGCEIINSAIFGGDIFPLSTQISTDLVFPASSMNMKSEMAEIVVDTTNYIKYVR